MKRRILASWMPSALERRGRREGEVGGKVGEDGGYGEGVALMMAAGWVVEAWNCLWVDGGGLKRMQRMGFVD